MKDDLTSRRDFLKTTLRLVGGAGTYSAVARFGGLATSTSLLAGCTTPRSPQEMVEKLVFGITADVKSFDPAMIIMATDGYISANIHETLTWYNKSLKLVPRLALEWKPLDGANRWRFHLRPNVRFHDGTPFDALAVKTHFDRIKNPKTKSNRISRVAPMRSVEILDPLTVEFHMVEPFSVWPEQIRSGWAGIASPKRLKAIRSPNEYTGQPVGTGPFVFKEYIPDTYIRLERNPDYWDPKAIQFESLEFRPIKEATTRLIMVEQGQLDVSPVSFAHVDLAARSDKMKLARSPHLATSYVGFNCMRAPLDKVEVRRAINQAVDRRAIVEQALRGSGFPAHGPIPRAVVGKNPKVTGYAYNPDASRQALSAAGVKSGTTLVLWSTERSEEKLQCELLKEMLREVGLNVEPRIIDQTAYWGRFDKYQRRDAAGKPEWRPNDLGVFDMFIAGWVGGESPWGFLDPLFRSSSTSNSCFYKSDIVDAMLRSALAEEDSDRRARLFMDIEAQVVSDAPWLFMYDRELAVATRPGVEGYTPHQAGEYEFQGVTLQSPGNRP